MSTIKMSGNQDEKNQSLEDNHTTILPNNEDVDQFSGKIFSLLSNLTKISRAIPTDDEYLSFSHKSAFKNSISHLNKAPFFHSFFIFHPLSFFQSFIVNDNKKQSNIENIRIDKQDS